MDPAANRRPGSAWPGRIAVALLVLVTSFWTFWGTGEMYHEGWFGAWHHRARYLIPAASCLALSLIGLRRPLIGGLLLFAVGLWFTLWWGRLQIARGADLVALLMMLPISASLAMCGLLLVFEWRRRRRSTTRPSRAAYLVVVGVPVLVFSIFSAFRLPAVLGRLDDGDRGERLIEGAAVRLVWAPDGPGWARGEGHVDGNPSWNRIALYGLHPIGLEDKPGRAEGPATADEMRRYGLHRYLSRDGRTLLESPIDVWRMPTVVELVGSLCRDGRPVDATWDGKSPRASFTVQPEKETPLWAPDRSPIYYWAADERDESEAYWVSYNGWVRHQPKSWGNPRHGFRLVRDP